jgi:hypothetical protein
MRVVPNEGEMVPHEGEMVPNDSQQSGFRM